MKRIIKLASLGAVIAAFAGAAAYANDPQLQQRLTLQRAQDNRAGLSPAIALYSCHKGVGQAKNGAHSKHRFETR